MSVSGGGKTLPVGRLAREDKHDPLDHVLGKKAPQRRGCEMAVSVARQVEFICRIVNAPSTGRSPQWRKPAPWGQLASRPNGALGTVFKASDLCASAHRERTRG